MTHATWAFRATICRGRELNYGSHTYFLDHIRTWRASPDEWSAQFRGHLRDSTNMKDNTHQAYTQSSQQGEYGMVTTTAKWYSGTLWPKVSYICLTGEEKPRKTSPRKPVPTGDRTRARCVTSAHATTCCTVVDSVSYTICLKNVRNDLIKLVTFLTPKTELQTSSKWYRERFWHLNGVTWDGIIRNVVEREKQLILWRHSLISLIFKRDLELAPIFCRVAWLGDK